MNGSRMPGWHHLSRQERCRQVAQYLQVDSREIEEPVESGGLSPDLAQKLTENVIGIHSLPFSVAPNFIINGCETLVPMVIEEPSVVAAAANAARIVRAGGGFQVSVTDPIMICQIQIFTDDVEDAGKQIMAEKKTLLSIAAKADGTLVELGGGPVNLEVRKFSASDQPGFIVIHLLVDVLDAMGANTVNTWVRPWYLNSSR